MASLLGLPADGGGDVAGLHMLPLYKRCRRCRRFATYGTPGPVRREVKSCAGNRRCTARDIGPQRTLAAGVAGFVSSAGRAPRCRTADALPASAPKSARFAARPCVPAPGGCVCVCVCGGGGRSIARNTGGRARSTSSTAAGSAAVCVCVCVCVCVI